MRNRPERSDSTKRQLLALLEHLADDKGRLPETQVIWREFGRTVSLHGMTHLLWALQKEGLLTFRESTKFANGMGRGVNRPIGRLRLRRRR